MEKKSKFNYKFRRVFTCLSTIFCVAMFVAPGAYAVKNAEGVEPEAQQQQTIEKVNINEAGAKELSTVLKGVGLKKAQAIVSYRQANGKFQSVDHLAKVKGIGAGTVESNRNKLSL